MPRNVAVQILRGTTANMPTLGDGEFYFATDSGNLFVGLLGGNLKVANMALQISDPITIANIASVQPKGTQGAFFLGVQDAKDTGRTKVVLTLTKVAGITSEALVTMTIKKGTAATVTGTSYTVSAGKTLRLQSWFLGVTNITTATLLNVAARLREGAAGGGALSATSDIIAELETGNPTATLATSGQASDRWPDGLEIAANQQIGVSELASSVNSAVTIVIVGFEY